MDVRRLCQQGRLEDAVQLLDCVSERGIHAAITTYTCILKACIGLKALAQGRQVHAHVNKNVFVPSILMENTLVDMYGKCGSLIDARDTFDKMHQHNIFSWTVIISAYVKEGKAQEAVVLFHQMRHEGVMPDKFVFVVVLKACKSMEALEQGRQVHGDIIKSGIGLDTFLCSILVDLYAKCGYIEDARHVFDNMSDRDGVSWNAMILGYAQQGLGVQAITVFEAMLREGMKPNEITFAGILKACAILADLKCGKQFHSEMIRCGFGSDAFLGSSLLDMYIKCHSIEDAQQVFNKLHARNVVSWTVMIAGYAQQRLGRKAFSLFGEMQEKGVNPNEATFTCVLKACAIEMSIEKGRRLHAQITKGDIKLDAFVGTGLIDMYVKCGRVEDARQVLKSMPDQDVVSWNTIITRYTQQGFGEEALAVFRQMQSKIEPEEMTFVSVLNACAGLAALEQGKQLHAEIVERGFGANMFVGSTLVDMYAKCGCIKDARQIFSQMHEHDVVVWNTMLAGYAQQGLEEEAVTLFEQMNFESVEANEATFVIILKVCASMATIEWGKYLHYQVSETGFEANLIVRSALLDMYAKCGSVEDACTLFNQIKKRDVVSWTAMITGYAQQGLGKEALALFDQMQQEGVRPNEITFISVLSGCSHAGLLDEGHLCFDSMSIDYGITPTTDHYACMVDLLGRAGHLLEAFGFLKAMPGPAHEVLWTTLLAACKVYGNVEVAKQVAEEVMKLYPQNPTPYVQLSNIYAMTGMWEG